jgi:hypothetical protein
VDLYIHSTIHLHGQCLISYAQGQLYLYLLLAIVNHLKIKSNYIKILDCEAIGTAATPGLLCQLRVIVKMIVEKQMEC